MIRVLILVLAMVSLAFPGAARADDDALKNKGRGTVENEVVIGSFTVSFFHLKKDRMRTFDGGRKTMEVALSGLTAEQLQAVTEVAYTDFVEQLQAAGLTVRDRSDFAATLAASDFEPLDQGHEAKMYFGRDNSQGRTLLFSPASLGGPVPNRELDALTLIFRGFQMTRMSSAMAFDAAAKSYAEDSGVAVINPILVIDFADFDKYEGKYVRAIEAQSSLALMGEQNGVNLSAVQFYGANGKMGRIQLKEDIAVAGGFGRIERDGGTPLGRLMGLSTKAKYSYTADVQQWADGMASLITTASPMFAQAIAAR